MARWKLQAAHYLKVEDCYWEQTETDRETGRQRRKHYPVPMYLDPKDPANWNYKPGQANILVGGNSEETGSIVVCHKGKGYPKDYVFEGDPTPEMEPLDDEAKEITNRFIEAGTWIMGDPNDTRTAAELRLDMAAGLLGDAASKDHTAELIAMQRQMTEAMAMIAHLLANPRVTHEFDRR